MNRAGEEVFMDLSKITGRERLAGIKLNGLDSPLVGRQGGSTKCCATGTCDKGWAQGVVEVEVADEMDAELLAAKLGSLG